MPDGRTEWEYRLFVQHIGGFPRVTASMPLGEMRGDVYQTLNSLGDGGWELVSATQLDRDRLFWIFKRPKQEG
jgi:hypothetical protein